MKDDTKDKKINKAHSAVDLLTVFLFFCGVALIAVGLYQFWQPLALVFLGIACLYVAACIAKTANSPRKDGKQ